MKTKIDYLGRIGIPKNIRSLLHWEEDAPLDIRIQKDTGELILKRSEKVCLCCGTKEDLFLLKDEIYLCTSCAQKIQK